MIPDAVAEQIVALKDEDWAIREEAALALGTYRDSRAVLPLILALRDADRAVRTAVVASLTSLGPPAVPALGLCLSDQDLTVQEAAAGVLATIADARVVAQLFAAVRSPDWVVRMHTATALGRIADPQGVAVLLPLLQDKVKAVREAATGALSQIGPAAVPSLLDAIRHDEWLVRLHAVEALGKLKAREAVDPLLSVLFNDSDEAVREDAVRALGEIGDARAVDFLLTAMKTPGLRVLAIEALGKIGDRRAVPALTAVVTGQGRPDHVRPVHGCGDRWEDEMSAQAAAVKALAQIRDEAAVPVLVAALTNTVTRADAATALAAFGQPAVAALLGVLKREQDDNIVYYAKDALAQLGWRPGRI